MLNFSLKKRELYLETNISIQKNEMKGLQSMLTCLLSRGKTIQSGPKKTWI